MTNKQFEMMFYCIRELQKLGVFHPAFRARSSGGYHQILRDGAIIGRRRTNRRWESVDPEYGLHDPFL